MVRLLVYIENVGVEGRRGDMGGGRGLGLGVEGLGRGGRGGHRAQNNGITRALNGSITCIRRKCGEGRMCEGVGGEGRRGGGCRAENTA